jgi:hypothetical protein
VRVSKHFEVRFRKLPTQGGNRGQGQYEITYRATANHQDLTAQDLLRR